MQTTKEKFETIINRTKPLVMSAIQRHLSSKLVDFIDDVAQETYLRAYKKLIKTPLEDIEKLEPYLFQIAKNESFRMNKREGKYIQIHDYLEAELTSPSQDKETNLEAVNHLIETLPTGYQQILTLFKDGYSLKEIGVRLNLNTGAVKSKLFRGKKLLIASKVRDSHENF